MTDHLNYIHPFKYDMLQDRPNHAFILVFNLCKMVLIYNIINIQNNPLNVLTSVTMFTPRCAMLLIIPFSEGGI